jgi:hypothetical protein
VTTALASWTKSGTGWETRTLDVDVVYGDRVSVDLRAQDYSSGSDKSYTSWTAYARIQNVRFKTGGENLIPGVYAPVEND